MEKVKRERNMQETVGISNILFNWSPVRTEGGGYHI
jgi:hypothetical protein